jgi:hypothetical protein
MINSTSVTNIFTGGLNYDVHPLNVPNDQYIDAENIVINANTGGTNTSIQGDPSTTQIQLYDEEGNPMDKLEGEIIHTDSILDYMVIFTELPNPDAEDPEDGRPYLNNIYRINKDGVVFKAVDKVPLNIGRPDLEIDYPDPVDPTKVTYLLSYDLNGGTISNYDGGTPPGSYHEDDPIIMPATVPVKHNHSFQYYTDDFQNGIWIAGVTIGFRMPGKDVIFTAIYKENSEFSNTETCGIYTKNDCASHMTGSEERICVPEGTFFGESQYAADLLANSWLRDNGQSEANRIGSCSIAIPTLLLDRTSIVNPLAFIPEKGTTLECNTDTAYRYEESADSLPIKLWYSIIGNSTSASSPVYTTLISKLENYGEYWKKNTNRGTFNLNIVLDFQYLHAVISDEFTGSIPRLRFIDAETGNVLNLKQTIYPLYSQIWWVFQIDASIHRGVVLTGWETQGFITLLQP